MNLSTYLQQTQLLLNNPSASIYPTANLTSYINTARSQLAGEGECIRAIGTLATASATQVYAFSAITLTTGVGLASVLAVRGATVGLANGGAARVDPRPWEWFNAYALAVGSAVQGQPTTWAQYGQGGAGTVYLDPTPLAAYSLKLDCVCLPITLSSSSDPEALPYPWTDAVPYFAAYLALLNAQRLQDADSMLGRYEVFTRRARQLSTPTVLPGQYPGGLGARGAASATPVTGAGGGGGPSGGAGGR